MNMNKVSDLSMEFPRAIVDGNVYKYSYGTAGFRDHADRLDSAMLRVGMLAALQSMHFDGRIVGVMVTASHNMVRDNGAKIMDYRGEMLHQSWERFANELVNAQEGETVGELIQEFMKSAEIKVSSTPPKVFIGMDTRPSSEHLSDLVKKGVESIGGEAFILGQTTTPQLHWIVREINQKPEKFAPLETENRGEADLAVYSKHMATEFQNLLPKIDRISLKVDCAHGIGFVGLGHLKPLIDSVLDLDLFNINIDEPEKLNNHVGAEHVQKNRLLPDNFPNQDHLKLICSVDGDADRVVFYYVNEEREFRLMDGDKISAIVAKYIQNLVIEAEMSDLSVGVVQTAYANGSSTEYMSSVLQVPVVCVSTGVKHLHHKAAEFDIGIYFEANGHGTVLFSEIAQQKFEQSSSKAAKTLKGLGRLVNQAVGDAISDILLVLVVLNGLGISFQEWDRLYQDKESCQKKVAVPDRTKVVTTDSERRVESPVLLQDAIDTCIQKAGDGARAFVRPSGTEDVVRIYAEACSKLGAKQLADEIEENVLKIMKSL